MALDATVGTTTANSYVTRDEADAYLNERYYDSAWANISPATRRDALLMQACDILENFKYKGYQSNPVGALQRLKWPRQCIWNEDKTATIATNAVPRQMKEAQIELAYELSLGNPADEVTQALRQFQRLKLPGIELEMRDPIPSEGVIPSAVMRKIAPFLSAGPGITRLVRA